MNKDNKELLGYMADGFPGTVDDFRNHLRAEDSHITGAAVVRHPQEHMPYNVVYRLRTKSGEYRWYHDRICWNGLINASSVR